MAFSFRRLEKITRGMNLKITVNPLYIFLSTDFLFNNPSKVCYEKYGCFSKQPSVRYGLISIQPSLPQKPSAVGTTFDLYTKEGYGRIDDFDTDKLKAPKFDMSRRTIFVIHGWRGECQSCLWLKHQGRGAIDGLRSLQYFFCPLQGVVRP